MCSSKVETWKFLEDTSLEDFSVIVPSVAVGNVAQLACDLIISSLEMKKVASIYSPALISIVGYNPYDLFSDELMSSCELYISDKHKLAVLQFRAPLLQKNSSIFIENVLKKFKEHKVKEIILLTSSYDHEKKAILTSPFRYKCNKYSNLELAVKKLDWREIENSEDSFVIHGGGFAAEIFKQCTELSVPSLLLFKYSSEGDNTPDARVMVLLLNSLLRFLESESKLVEPISWKYLFGRPPPGEIY